MTTARHPAAGFTLIELLIVLAILGIVAAFLLPLACRPQCELRRVNGCDYQPAHQEWDPCDNSWLDSELNQHCMGGWDYVPDRWFLEYDEGWSRQVARDLCEREGGLRRYEFRDGSRYTYHDQPVTECSEVAP